MNTFKKKSLYAALAGVSALGVVNVAQAVNVNSDGTGQALIYPYYTTRVDALGNVFSTLISVVNTQNTVKAVKVRFLEGKNSREVLDFNLFLSPYDVWTGAVMADSVSGGAKVATRDKSCTLPVFPASGEVSFVNYAYTGAVDDGGGVSLDRTKEGYFEIIEMADYPSNTTTAKAVTHVNGVAPCSPLSDAQAKADGTAAPSGGLFGSLQLVNALTGTAFSASAVALDNYKDTPDYGDSGSVKPTLAGASPAVSQVVAGNAVYTSTWADLRDPVSAVLMHNNVLNEYVLDANTVSRTDWVVTFPTKREYVLVGTGNAPGTLFQRNFNKTAGACDDILLNIYDREEQTQKGTLNFSPPPPTQVASLCWEANVLSFTPASGGSTTVSPILGSTNVSFVPYVFQNGWLNLGFQSLVNHRLVNVANTSITTVGGSTTAGNTVTYWGLPVVGFAAASYTNGTLTVGTSLVQSSYGVDFGHRYTTSITK